MKILNEKRKNAFNKFKNPYGEGGASKKIINILESINYDNILQKHFINLKMNIR